MPYIQEHHKKVLGPLIDPFGRNEKKSIEEHLKIGEKEEFTNVIYFGNDNNPPLKLNETRKLT